jgi:hypothetical protein
MCPQINDNVGARGLIEAVLTNPWERQINPAV